VDQREKGVVAAAGAGGAKAARRGKVVRVGVAHQRQVSRRIGERDRVAGIAARASEQQKGAHRGGGRVLVDLEQQRV